MKVLIPTPLRPYTGKQATVEVAAATVAEMLAKLTGQFPDLRQQLFSDDGKLRRFVNVYVNDEDIRYLENESTPVKENDTVSIVPSVAGGKVGDSALQLVDNWNEPRWISRITIAGKRCASNYPLTTIH
jgi:molybdopterin converting factor small subunit